MKWTTTYSIWNKKTGKKVGSKTVTYQATDKARATYLSQLFAYINIDKDKLKVKTDSIKKA